MRSYSEKHQQKSFLLPQEFLLYRKENRRLCIRLKGKKPTRKSDYVKEKISRLELFFDVVFVYFSVERPFGYAQFFCGVFAFTLVFRQRFFDHINFFILKAQRFFDFDGPCKG